MRHILLTSDRTSDWNYANTKLPLQGETDRANSRDEAVPLCDFHCCNNTFDNMGTAHRGEAAGHIPLRWQHSVNVKVSTA